MFNLLENLRSEYIFTVKFKATATGLQRALQVLKSFWTWKMGMECSSTHVNCKEMGASTGRTIHAWPARHQGFPLKMAYGGITLFSWACSIKVKAPLGHCTREGENNKGEGQFDFSGGHPSANQNHPSMAVLLATRYRCTTSRCLWHFRNADLQQPRLLAQHGGDAEQPTRPWWQKKPC